MCTAISYLNIFFNRYLIILLFMNTFFRNRPSGRLWNLCYLPLQKKSRSGRISDVPGLSPPPPLCSCLRSVTRSDNQPMATLFLLRPSPAAKIDNKTHTQRFLTHCEFAKRLPRNSKTEPDEIKQSRFFVHV